MSLVVAVVGFNAVGKRIVSAIERDPQLQLAFVHDSDPLRREAIAAAGLPLGDLETLAERAQAAVICEGEFDLPVPCVLGPDTPPGPSLWDVSRSPEARSVRVGCADSIALRRILAPLPAIERVFSSCARRVDRNAGAFVDALEPLFGRHSDDDDLEQTLAGVPFSICRTRVPCTRSHVHHLKIDLREEGTSREAIVEAFRSAARVRLGRGRAGFANTGLLQEFDRDVGRPRGDRPETFVWEETIALVDRSLFLTIDVDPDATPVPDLLDALRAVGDPDTDADEIRRRTDIVLGIGA